MNKILKKATSSNKPIKLKNKMGLKLAALALALGIGSFSLVNSPKETLTLGMTKDISTDVFEDGIPLYSDKETKKIITILEKNVLLISQEKFDNANNEQAYLISAIDKNNMVISGYLQHKYINNAIKIDKENVSTLYKVIPNKGVNLRKSAEISDDNKISGIPKNAILFGSKESASQNDWSKIIYYNGDSLNEGFVANRFLETVAHTADNKKVVNHDFKYSTVNKDEVFGIDVSDIHPKRLEQLLTGQLSLNDSIKNKKGKTLDISKYEDKTINFVYIKLMASSLFSKELKQGKPTRYESLAQICEKNKIPYGFYYYSTCTTDQEAAMEHTWISELLTNLKENKFNLLPIAIDVEVHSDKDRQYSVPIKTLTSAKAKLANLLENDFGKTILYTSRNACDNTLQSKILDIKQYQEELYSGTSHIWYVAPEKSKRHQASLEQISEHVKSKQIALDVRTDNGIYNVIDLNVIKEDAFKQYLDGSYKTFDRFIVRDKRMYMAQNDQNER